VISTPGSNGSAAAPTQSPSLQAGPNSNDPFSLAVVVGSSANPITLSESSDEDNGSATIPKVINNNEIASFYLLLFRWMSVDLYSGRLSYF